MVNLDDILIGPLEKASLFLCVFWRLQYLENEIVQPTLKKFLISNFFGNET